MIEVASLALVNWYLSANVLLVVAALLLAAIEAISLRLARPFTYRHLQQLGYAISVAAVLLPLIGGLSARHERLFPNGAQVWFAPTMQAPIPAATDSQRITVSLAPAGTSMSLSVATRFASCVFFSGLLVVLARVAMDAWAITRIIAGAQLFYRRGRWRILSSETVAVPFSFWIPGQYFIVIPSPLILRPHDLRMAIRHEAQHHRQADTKFLYLNQLARGLFYWNPAAHRLGRQILELQEFACDEAVVGRRPHSAHGYCRCLLSVGEEATRHIRALLQADMAGGSTGTLKRRIETVLARPKAHLKKQGVALTGVIAVAVLGAFTLAVARPVTDRRIDPAEAEHLAMVARRGSEFPITMNERVLEQLNLLLGTPDGRAYLDASLARKARYESFISKELHRYGLPPEIIAVPLVESGFRVLPAGKDSDQGAGLWMFIESTARRFGLEVTETKDERLSVQEETTAAMRLLSSLQRRFHDWNLTLLAFNAGQDSVERGMRETGSTDAWDLVRSGYENDPNYLPRVMAVILIIRNPTVLD
jgi:membrane-bound lytic murein transglycosylase D